MYTILEEIYHNPLSSLEDVENFIMEGEGILSFPKGKLRMENGMEPSYGQESNFVFWCHKTFPDHIEITWEYLPIRDPGLSILFFAAIGKDGQSIFDSALEDRKGPYGQYHSGDINALHISYFRRRYPEERQFHLCNLRKSKGFHMVAQSPDPLPPIADMTDPYLMKVVKSGPRVLFYINDLLLFQWEDDGESYGPILSEGKIGFRQMAPLMAEYSNFSVRRIKWQ